MVVGSFLRGGRGLIGWAIPLAIAGLITTTVPVGDYTGGFGNIVATPRTAAEVQPVDRHTAGDIDLDLTELTGTTPVTTEIYNGGGSTEVVVPANADVHYDVQLSAGTAECFGRQTDGLNSPPLTGQDLGDDGPGGMQINLKVTAGAGDVEVRRG
jgi:Cell wall-active antibiotics response 4TMS YvqF